MAMGSTDVGCGRWCWSPRARRRTVRRQRRFAKERGLKSRPSRIVPWLVESWAYQCRRSCRALDGHDDAAAEAQFRANEFSVLDEALAHNRQRGPKLLVFVPCQVHVINEKDAALEKCPHGPAQLGDLPTG